MNQVVAFAAKNWKGLLILAFVLLFALYFFQRGKSKGEGTGFWDVLNGYLNGSGSGNTIVVDPGNYGECPEGFSPAGLSKRLHDGMKGLSGWWGNSFTEWRELAELDHDCHVVMVYNHFNQNYGGGKTLYEWINDEFSYGNDYYTAVLTRLANLQLA